MPIPGNIIAFWSDFTATVSGVDESRFYEAFCFGDSEVLADELAALVLVGTKRATAGSLWSYEASGRSPPTVGALSVVTNWAGTPPCVIETQSVEVCAFSDVTAEFAATEGEGDASLDFWRAAHTTFFTRECAAAGREFTHDMRVVCERFRVIYQPT